MRPGELVARLVAEALCLQAVGTPSCVEAVFTGPARGQQDRRRDAHRALVREQRVIGPAAVTDVLVDVDDRLGCRKRIGSGVAIDGQPSSARLEVVRNPRRSTCVMSRTIHRCGSSCQ